MPRTRNSTKAATAASANKKQPLQDITDRFVPPHQNATDAPAKPIGRRNHKPPAGALAAKLRAARNLAIPSSLPPSSPPSTSSHHPAHVRRAPLHEEDDDDDKRPTFPFVANARFEFDVGQAEEEQGPSDNLSDPFGFFAVERKLKAQRDSANPTRARYRYRAPPAIAIPPQDEEVDDDQPTPLEYVDEPEDEPLKENLIPPPTPPKHHRKRRALHSPGESSSSMPSSPSPLKPSKGKGKDTQSQNLMEMTAVDESQEEIEQILLEKVINKVRGKEKGKEKEKEKEVPKPAGRRAKKPRSSGVPVDPEALARSLEALLPKRPVRRVTRGSRKKAVEESDEEESALATKKKKATGAKKARGRPPKVKGKAKAAEDGLALDADQREKWELERQARREYFEKLKDYQVAKENVYVV